MLYDSECWHVKKAHIQRLIVAEIKMIGWMCVYTRVDRIRNEIIRYLAKVAPIKDKMREIRLRWFGHVKRRSVDAPTMICEIINIRRQKRERTTKKEFGRAD